MVLRFLIVSFEITAPLMVIEKHTEEMKDKTQVFNLNNALNILSLSH